MVIDNGGGDDFFSVAATGVLAFFDGEDWWALMSDGLWCVGVERRNFALLGTAPERRAIR